MKRRMTLLVAAMLLAWPATVATTDTPMRAYVDDCYASPGWQYCVGWAVGNGFRPNSTYTIGQCDAYVCVETAVASVSVFRDSRPDVCAVVHAWGWQCDTDADDLVGLWHLIDVSQLAPGWYYLRHIAWVSTPPTAESSPTVYWFQVTP